MSAKPPRMPGSRSGISPMIAARIRRMENRTGPFRVNRFTARDHFAEWRERIGEDQVRERRAAWKSNARRDFAAFEAFFGTTGAS
jgi:hypothetical protein